MPVKGAEDVEIDDEGFVYSGLSNGKIVRFTGNGSNIEVIAKSEGAIFGINLNEDNDKLVLADQRTGIKLLDLKNRVFQFLIS